MVSKVRICLRDESQITSLQIHDGPFAQETPACPEGKEIRMYRGVCLRICLFDCVSLKKENYYRSFFKTQMKDLHVALSVKNRPRVMSGPMF